jgi:hypothetical protein
MMLKEIFHLDDTKDDGRPSAIFERGYVMRSNHLCRSRYPKVMKHIHKDDGNAGVLHHDANVRLFTVNFWPSGYANRERGDVYTRKGACI